MNQKFPENNVNLNQFDSVEKYKNFIQENFNSLKNDIMKKEIQMENILSTGLVHQSEVQVDYNLLIKEE